MKDKKEIKDYLEGIVEGIEEEVPAPGIEPVVNLESDVDLFSDVEEEEIQTKTEETEGSLGGEESIEAVTGGMENPDSKVFKSKDDEVKMLLLSVVSALTYPADYPNVDELFNMKKTNGDIYIIELGSFVDKISYNTDVKTYIFTSAKPHHFDLFKKQEKNDDLESTAFSDFLIKETILHPKLTNKDIENMSAGEYFYILNHIRSKSYLNTEASIVKI